MEPESKTINNLGELEELYKKVYNESDRLKKTLGG